MTDEAPVLSREPEKDEPGSIPEALRVPAIASAMKVLLLAKGSASRRRLRRVLERPGWEVRSHADAEAAYEDFLAFRPSVAVVDAAHVDRNGPTFWRRIRDTPAVEQPVVILILGAADEPGRALRFDPEADDLVCRPIREAELLARMAVAQRAVSRGWKRSSTTQPPPSSMSDHGGDETVASDMEGTRSIASSTVEGAFAGQGGPLWARLRRAIQEERLGVQYQPLVSAATERVEGFEALVRWHEPDLGWVPPDRFVPLAEARGLIVELGRQLTNVAFGQLSAWRDDGHEVGISINVSKRQLLEPEFCEDMRELARRHRLTVDWITFEVTERQSLLHDAICRQSLEQLGAAGFRLSLDDFGSGHSAFDMVAEIPFRELKMDMDLCRKAGTPRGEPIARAIVEMCRTLELDSVAEGIEDTVLKEIFRNLGVTRMQGYLFSRPLSGEAAGAFLAERGPDRP